MEHIHTGQIILLGDAANASIPNIGQGASQAVEDAVYLAKWVSTVSPVEDAILKYEQHRQERIKRIKDDMKLYGLAARIDFPLLCSLRNKMMQLTPASYHSGKLRKIIEIEEEL
ncbi:FAD-dependent monooxygenase [Mesobacillus subterraneus]|uniref:FAD-dependent monooxygenase n=1 Tax=Mesobacillus subterraneus TaxID=285983 RepID=UPI0014737A1A|nr:FAD-dependent monooxygenase [Mesobacillus subterraneus]